MRANLTISLAIGLAIHVARELCETAELDVDAGRTLGGGSQLAARNLRDLVAGMPRSDRPMIIATLREYSRFHLHKYSRDVSKFRAVLQRVRATVHHARTSC